MDQSIISMFLLLTYDSQPLNDEAFKLLRCHIPLCELALGPIPAKLESQMLIHSNARWHLLKCSPTATLAKLDLQLLRHSNPCSGMAYSHKKFLLMCKVVKLFLKIT